MSTIQTGKFELSSNSPSETGSSTATFESITFPTPFPAGSQVVVIPMVQTFGGPHTPGLRIADVSETGFKIRMNELVSTQGPLSDGPHNQETIGWVAFSV